MRIGCCYQQNRFGAEKQGLEDQFSVVGKREISFQIIQLAGPARLWLGEPDMSWGGCYTGRMNAGSGHTWWTAGRQVCVFMGG